MPETPPPIPPDPDPLWTFPHQSFADATFLGSTTGPAIPAQPAAADQSTSPAADDRSFAADDRSPAADDRGRAPGAADDRSLAAGYAAMGYPPPVAAPAQVSPVQDHGRRWRKKAGAGGAAAAGIAKFWVAFKGLAILLKLKTALSMLIAIGAYTLIWGWKFAVGFVLILFVHEMGHVVALRAQGIKATAPMFVPFLGAFISYKTPPRSAAQESASALAGPAAGLVASGAALLIAEALDSNLLRAIAYAGFLINLFNLIPALPLDGGRVAGALHPAVWFVGMAAVIGLIIWRPSIVLGLVLFLGGREGYRRWRAYRSGAATAYYAVGTVVRWRIAGAYVAIAALCAAGMFYSYVPSAVARL